jgi:hypothetical protein
MYWIKMTAVLTRPEMACYHLEKVAVIQNDDSKTTTYWFLTATQLCDISRRSTEN